MENMKTKIYLHFFDEEYYGYTFEWNEMVADCYFINESVYSQLEPEVKTKDARIYTIEAIKYHIDKLSEFIKPSILLDFIKTIEDPNTGEELYGHLQENVRYINSLVTKIFKSVDSKIADEFDEYVFGRKNTDNRCHLVPFNNDENLMHLLRPHDEFVEWFKGRLSHNIELYNLAYDYNNFKAAKIDNLERIIKNLEAERDKINSRIEEYEKDLAELKEETK